MGQTVLEITADEHCKQQTKLSKKSRGPQRCVKWKLQSSKFLRTRSVEGVDQENPDWKNERAASNPRQHDKKV